MTIIYPQGTIIQVSQKLTAEERARIKASLEVMLTGTYALEKGERVVLPVIDETGMPPTPIRIELNRPRDYPEPPPTTEYRSVPGFPRWVPALMLITVVVVSYTVGFAIGRA